MCVHIHTHDQKLENSTQTLFPIYRVETQDHPDPPCLNTSLLACVILIL